MKLILLHYYGVYLNNKDRNSNSDIVYGVLHYEIVESIITALGINPYKSIKTLWFIVVLIWINLIRSFI